MAVGALADGVHGGRVAIRIQPIILGWIVIGDGLVVAVVNFLK